MLEFLQKIKNYFRHFIRKADSGKLLYYDRIFSAVLLFRLCCLVMVYFTLDLRQDIPAWMYLIFKNICFPLFFLNSLFFLFRKKLYNLLVKHKWLVLSDLLVAVPIILIGAGWRSSYFFYPLTSVILVTVFFKSKGALASAFIFAVISLLKNPSTDEGSSLLVFGTSNLDMRMGAVQFFIFTGIIIAYISTLLDKIIKLSEEKISAVKRQSETEQKMKLAFDLHDNIKSKVTAIILLFNPLMQKLFKKIPQAQDELIKLWKWLNYLQDDTISLFESLKESAETRENERFDIQNMIHKELINFEEITGFKWKLVIEANPVFLSATESTSVLRFISEAIMNAWKHSSEQEGEMKIMNDSGKLHISVTDFGKGFDFQEKLQEKTSGLKSMKMRADDLNGTIAVSYSNDQGCTVSLIFPLEIT